VSHRVPKHRCPHCQHELSAVWEPGEKIPRPGDYSICIACGGWLVLTRELKARKPNVDERIEIRSSSEAQALHRLWTQFMTETGRLQ
jgi:hypothetical protein